MSTRPYVGEDALRELVRQVKNYTSSMYIVKGSVGIYDGTSFLPGSDMPYYIAMNIETEQAEIIDGQSQPVDIKEGWVFNLAVDLTIPDTWQASPFIDRAPGDIIKAGTNICIIQLGDPANPLYVFDCLATDMDLTPYQTRKFMNADLLKQILDAVALDSYNSLIITIPSQSQGIYTYAERTHVYDYASIAVYNMHIIDGGTHTIKQLLVIENGSATIKDDCTVENIMRIITDYYKYDLGSINNIPWSEMADLSATNDSLRPTISSDPYKDGFILEVHNTANTRVAYWFIDARGTGITYREICQLTKDSNEPSFWSTIEWCVLGYNVTGGTGYKGFDTTSAILAKNSIYKARQLVQTLSYVTPDKIYVGSLPTTGATALGIDTGTIAMLQETNELFIATVVNDNITWTAIGDQITVEGSLKLISNLAPNRAITATEVAAMFNS